MDHVDKLLAAACAQTGLSDFGSDEFREGLGILVSAMDREGRLNAAGRAAMDGQVVLLLANRLEVEDWYKRHPEIDEQEILAPLIGLGLPRTGSSALSCLLGEDKNFRSLRSWEATWPCPPPETATYHTDPRIAKAEAGMEIRAKLFPRMVAMLPSSATSPMECQMQMGMDFKSHIFQPYAHMPSYVDWLVHKADLVPTYRYVKRVLKLLQWRCPPNSWRLKNPSHSMFIFDLDKVFPDARFVMTHRDITAVAGSVADLYYELRKSFSDAVDLHELGAEVTEFLKIFVARMIAFRDSGQDHRFYDLHFAALQKDPLACVQGLYDFLGETLDPAAREAMHRWWYATPPEDRAYERTDPAAFGLDRAALRQQFHMYAERFPAPELAA